MNNLLSYCGLVDPRISVSDKNLPVMTDVMEEISCFLRDINYQMTIIFSNIRDHVYIT